MTNHDEAIEAMKNVFFRDGHDRENPPNWYVKTIDGHFSDDEIAELLKAYLSTFKVDVEKVVNVLDKVMKPTDVLGGGVTNLTEVAQAGVGEVLRQLMNKE